MRSACGARTFERKTAMLENLKDLPPGVDGLKATGKMTKEDYERVFERTASWPASCLALVSTS
jgi:hypothetical protein